MKLANCKHIVLVLVMAFSFLGNAQEVELLQESDSEIIMTQEQLDSLLIRVAQKQRYLLYLRRKNATSAKKNADRASNSLSNDQIEEELKRINEELQNIVGLLAEKEVVSHHSQEIKTKSDTAVVDENAENNTNPVFQEDSSSLSKNTSNYNHEKNVKSTSKEEKPSQFVDKKTSADKEETPVDETISKDTLSTHENSSMKINAEDHKKETLAEDSIQNVDNLQSKSDLFSEEELKNFEKSVYFPNNTFEISKEDEEILSRLAASINDKKGRYFISINGFASAAGNEIYNQGISYLRAKHVQDFFKEKGVPFYRIKLKANGVDSKSSPEEARRVEVRIVLNRDH